MRKTINVLSAVVLAGALSLPVAAQAESTTSQKSQFSDSASQKALRGAQYDARIQDEVSAELAKHDWAKSIDASVEDGIVTLQGTVSTYSDKVRAYNKIHKKERVKGVRNLVVVAGRDVPDVELQRMLANKLRYDRSTQGGLFNNFNLAVSNGVVTIGGQARTPTDASSAIAIVESTPGVKGLIDNVEVLPTSFSDDEARIRVARAIYGDSALQRYAIDPQAPIRIVVDRGHVTLYGVVDSQFDKQVAVMRANQVPGIFSVDDRLAVASRTQK